MRATGIALNSEIIASVIILKFVCSFDEYHSRFQYINFLMYLSSLVLMLQLTHQLFLFILLFYNWPDYTIKELTYLI